MISLEKIDVMNKKGEWAKKIILRIKCVIEEKEAFKKQFTFSKLIMDISILSIY